MVEKVLNYIGGEWRECATGKTFDCHNPATGEVFSVAQNSGESDAQMAIEAARKAFGDPRWRYMGGKERAAILLKFAELLEKNEERLSRLICDEMGKPYRTALEREVRPSADRIRFFAGAARVYAGEITEASPGHLLNLVKKEPVGVCALIVPWNDPIDLLLRKFGAALAVGCTVVAKPASSCPASTMAIFNLLDEIEELPKGVVNCITGRGGVIGEYLAKSHLVDKVSFTGGTETGRRIMELAAGNMKKISLECGGKAPCVVFADANLEKVLDAVRYGAFAYAGQSCSAVTRVIIERSVHKKFVERLIEKTKELKIGDPRDPSTHVGPMVSESQMRKTLEYIEAGKSEGAKLVYGGKRLDEGELARGYFVGPTIFDEVKPEMKIAQEEIFGPVLCIMPFDREEEALEIANSTRYGLAAGVWSADVNRCIRVSGAIQAGDVWVNTWYIRMAESPYGGIKESGLGVELGMQGLQEYLVTRRICFDTSNEFHTKITPAVDH